MIYFIQVGETGPIKIGTAVDVRYRLSQLQVANPEALRLLGVFEATPGWDEWDLHSIFLEDHVRGEWFRPSPHLIEWIHDNARPLPAAHPGGRHVPPGVQRAQIENGRRDAVAIMEDVIAGRAPATPPSTRPDPQRHQTTGDA